MAAAAALAATTTLSAAPVAQADEVPHGGGFVANELWSQGLNDANGPIALSSPNVANLDGSPAVVVGDRTGHVYAFHISGGTPVAGWPYNAGAPVDASPSVAPIDANGTDTVYVGSGDAASPNSGGYQAIGPNGGDQWFVPETNPGTDPTPHSGVAASLTVGNYAGGYGVEAGSLGQNTYALGAGNGAVLGGFPWFQGDSVFSTAAVADLYADGNNEIISGGDSSAGIAYGQTYANGGHIRILSSAGNAGTGNPAGGLICQYNTNQNIDRSSPAVGQFLAGGGVGIAIGDGSYYGGASDSDKVFALNTSCGLAWSDLAQRRHSGLPRLGGRPGQRSARRRRGDDVEHHLRAERDQRRRRVGGTDERAGHRLAGHRRPHREWLPGRHRPHDGRDRHLRRPLGCRGGHPRHQLRVPELPARDRRPRRPHRHHRRGVSRHRRQTWWASSATGRSTARAARAPASTSRAPGRSSTTTPS